MTSDTVLGFPGKVKIIYEENYAPTEKPASLKPRAKGRYRRMPNPEEKQPYNIGMADDSVFAFAGLWERWRDPANEVVETFTILTTQPNPSVADVHDRMPVILSAEDYDLWLDPGVTDSARVPDCLKPFDARLMKKYPISARVNRVENDDEYCAREIAIASTTPTLF
jgi:putative SOS response-associated peptidase YedK